MSIHFYKDDCGCVGQPRRDTSREEAADAEGFCAYDAADKLAGLLDRHEGDWGQDADALAAITARITAIHDEVRALLGRPARAIWQGGHIVALVMEARS